jgi:predicted SnoaL-like aldol condensation-catalyzing enzyme
MGNDKKNGQRSRRQFFSSFFSETPKTEKIKMLTPDGKLVEVDKAVFEEAAGKKKASNKEIYNWMNNPSKENE